MPVCLSLAMLRGAREGWDGQRAVGVRGAGASARARGRGRGQRRASLGCGDGALGMSDTHVAQAVDVRVRDFDAVAFLLDIGTLWGEAHARALGHLRAARSAAQNRCVLWQRPAWVEGERAPGACGMRTWIVLGVSSLRITVAVPARAGVCVAMTSCGPSVVLRSVTVFLAVVDSHVTVACKLSCPQRFCAHVRSVKTRSDQSREVTNAPSRASADANGPGLVGHCRCSRARAGPIHVRWAH